MRILIDTNWFLSYLIKEGGNRQVLTSIFLNEKIDIIIGEKLIKELTTKIQQEKFRKYFTEEIGLQFIKVLIERTTNVEPTSVVNTCRDKKDNYLLELAKDAEADFLITGDKDLLVLNYFEKTRIVTLSEFSKLIYNIVS